MTPGCYYQTAIKLGIIQRVTSKLNVTKVAMTVITLITVNSDRASLFG